MWLLQHKNLHKKLLLWLKIGGLCLGFHLLALFWVFCVYQENMFMHNFTVNRKIDYSMPVVFKLLIEPEKAAAIPVQKTTSIKPIAKNTPQPKKSPPQKATIITPPPPHFAKATKGMAQPKPIELKKEEVKLPIEKKIETKKEEPVKALPQKNISVPAQEAKPVPVQTCDNYREVEALRRTAQLQKELVQQWHPPIGVPADCSCDVSFFVTKRGIIEKVIIAKSSGIMMFDISARQALFSMKMPQWTYGKSLTISFK